MRSGALITLHFAGSPHSLVMVASHPLSMCDGYHARTDLRLFTEQLVNHIHDSLAEAITNSGWRATEIGDARDGWTLLNRRLARDDVPQDLQQICARLALLFGSVGFPHQDDERIEAKLEDLIAGFEEICPTL